MDNATKPLSALALAAFAIGTTEFVIMGLLPEVARDLGVGIAAAGLLVSGYALGVAFGGPLLAIFTVRLPSRATLFMLLGLFIAGNIACALAPTYGWLMAARIVTAFCHAAFLGVGSVIAAGLVTQERRARAIALMIAGLTLATVLGVPLGTLLGQATSWRTVFWAVTATGIAAFAALTVWLPNGGDERRDLAAELAALKVRAVWRTLGISVVASTSMFTFFTYIAPILTDVSGVAPGRVSAVLFACGVGLTFGNYLGARLADWRPLPSLAIVLGCVAIVLVAFGLFGTTPLRATVLVVVWGVVAFAVCAIVQAEAVRHAFAAPNLAATLNIAALNLGNAFGAGLGALALAGGLSLASIPLVAGGVALLALAVTGAALLLGGRRANDLNPPGRARQESG